MTRSRFALAFVLVATLLFLGFGAFLAMQALKDGLEVEPPGTVPETSAKADRPAQGRWSYVPVAARSSPASSPSRAGSAVTASARSATTVCQ